MPSPVRDLTVGSDVQPAYFSDTGFKLSRLKIWRSNAATVAEALEEYNAELALLTSQEGSFPPFFSDSIYNPVFTGPFTQ